MSMLAFQVSQLSSAVAQSNLPSPAERGGIAAMREQRENNIAIIIDALTEAGKPLAVRQVAPLVGLSWEITRKWLTRMHRDGLILRCGTRGFYRYSVIKENAI